MTLKVSDHIRWRIEVTGQQLHNHVSPSTVIVYNKLKSIAFASHQWKCD